MKTSIRPRLKSPAPMLQATRPQKSKKKPKRDPAREIRMAPAPFNLNRRKVRRQWEVLLWSKTPHYQVQMLEPILPR